MSGDREMKIRILMSAFDQGASGPVKRLAQAASQANRQIKEQEKAVKALQRAQGNVESYRKVRTALAGTVEGYREARAAAARLRAEYDALESPTRAQTRALGQAERAAAKAQATYKLQADRLKVLRQEFRDAGASARRLDAYQTGLALKTASATRTIDRQRDALERLRLQQQKVYAAQARAEAMQGRAGRLAGGGAVAVGVGVAIAAPALGGVNPANELESSMTDIAQKAEIGRAASAAMGRELVALGPRVNKSAQELAAGVDVLASMGLAPQAAMKAIGPIAKTATAYKAEMADVSASSYAAIDNLKVPIDQLERVLDIQAFAGKKGAFELKDMAQYFPTLTAGYQRLGQGGVKAVADLSAALQITRKGAGDAGQAATNLDNLLQKINAPQTVAAFKKMGVDLPAGLKRAAAAGKDPIEAIAELTKGTLKGDMSRLAYLFQDAEVQKALTPLIQNLEEYRKIRDGALSSKGVVDRDFAERMKDGAEQAKNLRINSQHLQLQLASQLLPTVNELARFANSVVGGLSRWAAQHPRLAGLIAGGTVVLGLMVATLGALAIAAGAVLVPLAALQVAATVLGITFGAVAWPLVLIAAGIAAVVAGGYLLWKNWDWLKAKAGELIAWFTRLPAMFMSIGGRIVDGLVAGMRAKFPFLTAIITAAAKMLPDGMKQQLGIKSPSRVFVAIGGNVMSGLELGLRRGRGGPAGAMSYTAAAMSAAFGLIASPAAAGVSLSVPPIGAGAAGSAAAASPPIVIYLTINAAAGADGHQLGRQAGAALAQALGGRAEIRRGSFANDSDGD